MIIRRYTPPTCTLEITAKSSLFSWGKKFNDLEIIQFELHFDAPQLPEERQVKVKGDRNQLQALSDAVNSYVHKFISQSGIALNALGLTKQLKAEKEIETEENNNPNQIESQPTPETNTLISEGIYLQPKGLLEHDLFLGTLATPESGAVIHLDVIQLFDLATALFQYEAEAEAPPENFKWFKQIPSWAKIAALLVLTVGATALTIEWLNRSTNLQIASQKAAPPTNPETKPPIAIAPAPVLPPTPTPPTATPPTQQITPTPLPSPTSRLPKLPKILEKDNIAAEPNPSQFSTQPNLQAANVVRIPSLNTPAPQKTPSAALNNVAGDTSSSTSSTTVIKIPPPPPTIIPQIPPPPNTQPPLLSIPPESTADVRESYSPTPNIEKNLPPVESESSQEAPPDVFLKTPQPNPAQTASTETASTQAPRIPRNPEPAPPLPRIEGLPDAASDKQAAEVENTASETISTPAMANKPAANEEIRGSLLNEAKQVVEARNYFQQRWQTQPDLRQPLEYTLLLNPDGSIKQFTPRGELSGKFIERTGMPLMNEKFVSPLQDGKTMRIRVLLKPDGKVQVFEESLIE
ncbi:MAG: DUF4335 domain-containing protein [Oscillatoriaceae bacterium SKW80]|nr:DUF4335 domain-containing protein [Oscillatoriaceae bacterium SKW80]HIK29108.1 DUF4335 domain-containing protein [Oscillatoriaceae cyanobacterium M7585_C2015_266]